MSQQTRGKVSEAALTDMLPQTHEDFLRFQRDLDEILRRAGVPYDEVTGWKHGSDGDHEGCEG